MKNVSLHFNDYEEKSDKNAILELNINIVMQNSSNLGFE